MLVRHVQRGAAVHRRHRPVLPNAVAVDLLLRSAAVQCGDEKTDPVGAIDVDYRYGHFGTGDGRVLRPLS